MLTGVIATNQGFSEGLQLENTERHSGGGGRLENIGVWCFVLDGVELSIWVSSGRPSRSSAPRFYSSREHRVCPADLCDTSAAGNTDANEPCCTHNVLSHSQFGLFGMGDRGA